MINWELTLQQFNRSDLSGVRPKVIVQCDDCGTTSSIEIRSKKKVINNQIPWQCRKCISNRPEMIASSRDGANKAWADPIYRQKLEVHLDKLHQNPNIIANLTAFREAPDFKERMIEINRNKVTNQSRQNGSIASKKLWNRDGFKDRMSKILSINTTKLWASEKYREKTLARIRLVCGSEEFKAKLKKRWDDPVFREKRRMMPRVSSLQTILYSILDDLGVTYFKERNDGEDDIACSIGPYSFDCVIPRPNKTTLLIECNGDYWHAQPAPKNNDLRKQSYITNNFGNQYEIKALWEHEFKNHNKIVETIKYWLGLSEPEAVQYSLSDLIIKLCPAKDYRLLLSKYHYIHNAGRGGIAYGAYLGDELAAVCVFSPLPRQNITIESAGEVKELSRLCIHPKYRQKNLASWFISRCIKSLPKEISTIVSYCDTTFNHDGATYKACNFVHDHTVAPDYWYVTEDGWATHKKTLYNHAVRMHMKEAEFAEKNGYKKVVGREKLRFIFNRN